MSSGLLNDGAGTTDVAIGSAVQSNHRFCLRMSPAQMQPRSISSESDVTQAAHDRKPFLFVKPVECGNVKPPNEG